jgi:FtsP/CotA-like multicopper oxidase with cupredoxin domain
MHLHGHDFLILGQSPPVADPLAAPGPVPFNPATDTGKLRFNNPARRDATMLPAWGWLVVAFKTDNPGAWLFHCHIAWHASQGLSVQFLERMGEIPKAMDLGVLEPNCKAWTDFYGSSPFKKFDSGL